MSTPEEMANDLTSPPEVLQQLAADPKHQVAVAKNPATYPGLLEWIATWGSPEAQQVAKRRLASIAPSDSTGAPDQETSGVEDATVLSSLPKIAAGSEAETSSREAADETILTRGATGEPGSPTREATDETVLARGHDTNVRNTAAHETVLQSRVGPAPSPTSKRVPQVPAAPPEASSTPLEVLGAPPQAPGTLPPLPASSASHTFPAAGAKTAQGPVPLPPMGAAPRASVPAQTPVPPSQDEMGTPMWVWALVGFLAAVVIGAAVWFLVLSPGNKEDAEVASPDPEVTEPAEEETEEEEVAKDKATEPVEEVEPEIDYSLEPVAPTINFPAPPDHVEASWFVSPDENIACEMGSTSTACTVYDYSFSITEGGCGSGPATLVVDLDGVQWDCSRAPVSRTDNGQAPILSASTSSATGFDACLSTVGGMSCWNTLNGNSFAVSRYGWTEGTSGLIPENIFPWIDQVERR